MQRLGIVTTKELSEYHLKFLSITTWLIEKQQLGDLEQKRTYTRAFQPSFLASINNCLQMKFPDHHPNIPHKIEDVYEAARFIVQSASNPTPSFLTPSKPPPFTPPGLVTILKKDPPVKTENLEMLMSEFTKTIIKAINLNARA